MTLTREHGISSPNSNIYANGKLRPAAYCSMALTPQVYHARHQFANVLTRSRNRLYNITYMILLSLFGIIASPCFFCYSQVSFFCKTTSDAKTIHSHQKTAWCCRMLRSWKRTDMNLQLIPGSRLRLLGRLRHGSSGWVVHPMRLAA